MTKKTDNVVALTHPKKKFDDPASMLRFIADQIDAGKYSPDTCVVGLVEQEHDDKDTESYPLWIYGASIMETIGLLAIYQSMLVED